jgi:integrase/recombinase XerD
MQPRVEQFIKERLYLTGVTAATVEGYRYSLCYLPSEHPTQPELQEMVIGLRQRGLKATTVNTVIRWTNAYLHWNSGIDQKCGAGCAHPHLKMLREPKNVLPTFTELQVRKLVKWKPRTPHEKRLHLLVLFLLDTGARVTEALTVCVSDIDLDNMLVKLDGKGRKQRIVPFSMELRRELYKYIQAGKFTPLCRPFDTNQGCVWDRRNVLRDVKGLCLELGFEAPARTVHALRHTFALNYLRRGGSTFHLQKSLGHSTLEMTRKYANLTTDDLTAVHQKVSLLHTM